ncbi:MAG TPA: D-2-hydroxyacid dehydrogenase [Acetobacteraceae bacterium]|nr:D-2-hydroxyacid dehydrogenase [Acetobacteraceae bacterium]
MRIHIQNDPDDPLFEITQADWQAAAARAHGSGLDGSRHDISIAASAAGFAAAIGEAEALVSASPLVRRLFPAPAPALRIVFCTSAGLDRLAPFDWLPEGAELWNNSGAHAAKGAEYVLMALLMLACRMPEIAADQRARHWQKRYGSALAGRRVVMVGLGRIGAAAAALAARHGMVVIGCRASATPHPDCARVVAPDALDDELPRADAVVLACPLTDATRNLLDARRIGLLRAGAGVVNVGRGAVLDQDALCDALAAGRLGGAVLDVFVPEPVPPEHRLWTTPNLVMTPHVSCDDPASYNAISLDIFLANLRAWRAGEAAPNRFDLARGY